MSTEVHDPLTLSVLVARRPTGVVETTWPELPGFGGAATLLFHGKCAEDRWQWWFIDSPMFSPIKVAHRRLSLHDKRTRAHCHWCDKPLRLKPF